MKQDLSKEQVLSQSLLNYRANEPFSVEDFAPKKPIDYNLLNKEIEDARAKAIAEEQKITQGNNTKEPIYYILVTAGVLVAGYFAYKKFKM